MCLRRGFTHTFKLYRNSRRVASYSLKIGWAKIVRQHKFYLVHTTPKTWYKLVWHKSELASKFHFNWLNLDSKYKMYFQHALVEQTTQIAYEKWNTYFFRRIMSTYSCSWYYHHFFTISNAICIRVSLIIIHLKSKFFISLFNFVQIETMQDNNQCGEDDMAL